MQQATWARLRSTTNCSSKPASGTYSSQWGGTQQPGSNFYNLVGVTEQCTNADCAAFGNISEPAVPFGHLPAEPARARSTWRGVGVAM